MTNPIQESFLRVKKDMKTIFNWITLTHDDVEKLRSKMIEMEERLRQLEAERMDDLKTV